MQGVEVTLRKFATRNPAANRQLLATRCSLRTCMAQSGDLCKSPSRKVSFYHVPRQQLSGVYDPQGVMYPRWEMAERAPGVVERIVDDLQTLEPAELAIVGITCQQLLGKRRIGV